LSAAFLKYWDFLLLSVVPPSVTRFVWKKICSRTFRRAFTSVSLTSDDFLSSNCAFQFTQLFLQGGGFKCRCQ
jgi:hypothetical protein